MDLLYIWHDYKYWSKILFDTISTPAYDLEAKLMDLEIYVKVLHQTTWSNVNINVNVALICILFVSATS